MSPTTFRILATVAHYLSFGQLKFSALYHDRLTGKDVRVQVPNR